MLASKQDVFDDFIAAVRRGFPRRPHIRNPV